MNAIWIAIKDLRLLVRDRVAVFWVLGFPLIFAVLFGEVIASASEQDERTSDLVVVDEAQTAASARILKALQDDERLEVTTADAAAGAQRGAPWRPASLPGDTCAGLSPGAGRGSHAQL